MGKIKRVIGIVLAVAMIVGLMPAEAVRAVYPVESTTINWSGDYVVRDNDITISANVTVSGDTTLTINNGCSLTVSGGISGSSTLTIYGEGTLIINNVNGSALNGGTVIITGCDVETTGTTGVNSNIILAGGSFKADSYDGTATVTVADGWEYQDDADQTNTYTTGSFIPVADRRFTVVTRQTFFRNENNNVESVNAKIVKTSTSDVNWSGGWYAIVEDTTINGDILLGFETTSKLIICDGATLTVNGGISGLADFFIYAGDITESIDGSGVLRATSNSDAEGDVTCAIEIYSNDNHRFASDPHSLKIYGGNIRLKSTGSQYGYGITASGNIDISGIKTKVYVNCDVENGEVNDLEGACGGGIDCNGVLSITGASVYSMAINCAKSGIYAQGGININGGNIIAIGGDEDVQNGGSGIGTFGEDICISGGTVIAIGGNSTYISDDNNGGKGINGNVIVPPGCTPTIYATGGTDVNGVPAEAILGTVNPGNLRVLSSATGSDPWVVYSGNLSNGVNAQFAKICPYTPTPTYIPPAPKTYTLASVTEPALTGTYLVGTDVKAKLSAATTISLTDGSSRSASITWSEISKTETEEKYKGTVSLPSDVKNPNGVSTEFVFTAQLKKPEGKLSKNSLTLSYSAGEKKPVSAADIPRRWNRDIQVVQ